jgi:hypothetical protein
MTFPDFVVICDRPEAILRDENNRLHSVTCAAVRFSDGFSVHAVHGVRVPAHVIDSPEKITVSEIENEQNAEVLRVMIDRYGLGRYLKDSGSTEIHTDKFGTLYRKAISNDEPIVTVKVRNSTPETDGTAKDYFLRVPPNITTAREAVAWGFGKTSTEYAPVIET